MNGEELGEAFRWGRRAADGKLLYVRMIEARDWAGWWLCLQMDNHFDGERERSRTTFQLELRS